MAGEKHEEAASALELALLVSAKAHADAGVALMESNPNGYAYVEGARLHAAAAADYLKALGTLRDEPAF